MQPNELFHANGWTEMTKLTDAIRYFANAPKNIHCNKKAQTQQHATTTLPAVTICTTSALCTTPPTNKPSHQSLSVPPQHSALPLPPTNPPSSHYLYHLSTLQYPSHQSLSVPTQHSALPSHQHTHFTPMYMFCTILALFTLSMPIGCKQTVFCAVRTAQSHAVHNSGVPASAALLTTKISSPSHCKTVLTTPRP